MIICLLALSVMLQFIGAVMLVRLIRLTGKRLAWALIAAAAILMAVRRLISLSHLIQGDPSFPVDINSEIIAVAISLLIVVGISCISTVFSSLQKAEEALEKSEGKYRLMIDTATEGILALGPEGMITFVNARMTEMIGYSSEEIIGRPFTDFMFEEDVSDHLKRMENRRLGRSENYERRFRCKDGRTVWTIASTSPAFDEKGHSGGSFGMFTDITERKRTEEALRGSEAKYRIVADNTCDWEFWLSPEDEFIYISPSCKRITGYTPEQFIADPGLLERITHSDDRSSLADHLNTARSMIPGLLEYRIIRSDGVVAWVEHACQPVFDENGNFLGTRGSNRDITDRKRSEQTLRERDAFIKNILESVDEGFIVVDRDFRILSANHAYLRLCGKTDQNVTGMHCYEMIHRFDKPCYECGEECPAQKAFSAGEPRTAMHKLTDGRKNVYLETKAYPMNDENGNVASVIEILVDVTEKLKLEEQLHHAQKMEAIGTLAGGIAHDFNNILTAITGYGDLLRMKMAPGDLLLPLVDHILSSAMRAVNLTRGLLAFSRKQTIEPKPVDLNNIVRNIEKLLRRLIGEDIEFTTRLTVNDLIVMTDEGHIEQVLMNLATNAHDAMPGGGKLVLTSDELDVKADAVSVHGLEKPGRYALLTVSDTGAGMDGQTQEKIFEPFFTTKELGKGTGLGLAIVFGIVKQHDGHIACYSEPGYGTTFKIYIPLVSMDVVKAQAVALPQPRGGPETILFAEDDDDVRHLINSYLKTFGYKVIAAADGQDAIDEFRRHEKEIDLVLLDVVMPRKSGKEVYDIVKAARPELEVLFISGYTADIIHKKGIFEEGLQFMSKPVSSLDLLRKVRELLDEK